MSSVIYPGLAYQALRITIDLYPGYSWDKIVNNAWHKYQQICHGVDREDNFYTWADQQRRERDDTRQGFDVSGGGIADQPRVEVELEEIEAGRSEG